MAAILHPDPITPLLPAGERPRLVLIEGGLSARRQAVVFRRRRILAAVVLAVLLVATVALGRAALAAVTPHAPVATAAAVAAPEPAGTPSVVVQAGDTYWSIARRLAPSGDVRALVDRLVAVNGSGALQPGARITVPG